MRDALRHAPGGYQEKSPPKSAPGAHCWVGPTSLPYRSHNSKCKPRGSLTNEETTEVEVGLVQTDERVRGFAYQQEGDCDVVFGD